LEPGSAVGALTGEASHFVKRCEAMMGSNPRAALRLQSEKMT